MRPLDRGALFRILRRSVRWKQENRRDAYRACFLGPGDRPTIDAEAVLADLKRFCKAEASSFVPGDSHATALNEGRREVWNRIVAHLYLTDATIAAIVEQSYPEEEGQLSYED